MDLGIFDHLDRREAPLDEFYESRLRLLERYDPSLPALQSIGYREFVQVARGALVPAEALRLMQRDTTRYAKRQWSWFAREPGVEWIDVERVGDAEGAAADAAVPLESGTSIRIVPSWRDVMKSSPSRLRLT